MQRLQTFCLTTIASMMVGYMLWVGQSFFLPLMVAWMLAYLISAITDTVRQLRLGPYTLPPWLATLLTTLFFALTVHGLVKLIGGSVQALLTQLPGYGERLNHKLEVLGETLGMTLTDDYGRLFEKWDFVSLTTLLLRTLTDVASSAGLIAVYFVFILMESRFFRKKLRILFPSQGETNETLNLIDKVKRKTNSYIKIKTLMSALTAISSFAVLHMVGVDFAALCALVIFLFNYIPTFGSICATLLPCALTLVQFDTYTPFLVVSSLLTSIQFCIGNFIEPRVMGNSFNLSGLVIILSLIIWGYIWGILGMVLSVPIMVIASIVLANFPSTRWLAVIISRDGLVEEK